MDISQIDFPSMFTDEQMDYIGQSVVDVARRICGDKLRDVILYGSYARGDFHEWSDVDMMVLADIEDTEQWRYEQKFIHELGELNHHMNLLLSVMVTPYKRFEYFKRHYPFYTNILREGKKLC